MWSPIISFQLPTDKNEDKVSFNTLSALYLSVSSDGLDMGFEDAQPDSEDEKGPSTIISSYDKVQFLDNSDTGIQKIQDQYGLVHILSTTFSMRRGPPKKLPYSQSKSAKIEFTKNQRKFAARAIEASDLSEFYRQVCFCSDNVFLY